LRGFACFQGPAIPPAWVFTGQLLNAEPRGVFFRYLTDKSRREKINELPEDEAGIATAGEVLLRISKDEAEQARLMSEYKHVADTQSKVVGDGKAGGKVYSGV
jgi:hypothetical protein